MYRGENVLARKDGRKPRAFETQPVLAEPSIDLARPPVTPKSEVDKIRQKRLRVKRDVAEAPAVSAAQSPPLA
jgi:hypothetical protein